MISFFFAFDIKIALVLLFVNGHILINCWNIVQSNGKYFVKNMFDISYQIDIFYFINNIHYFTQKSRLKMCTF